MKGVIFTIGLILAFLSIIAAIHCFYAGDIMAGIGGIIVFGLSVWITKRNL